MPYKKAKYIKSICCPECNFHNDNDDGMPDRYDFIYKTDDNGKEYIECPCGCRFKE